MWNVTVKETELKGQKDKRGRESKKQTKLFSSSFVITSAFIYLFIYLFIY